ncbi:exo-alpha-sialidase [Micromonospora soli]|uniref:exo-alpha-sialidase n=1 Tax=Micromonospora sp. NBRC 110009 TaxID=3061627 RepID=UPI00349FDD5F
MLRLSLSTDQGKTWTNHVDVESEPGADFSYPYLRQTGDGMIHLAYTRPQCGYGRTQARFALPACDVRNSRLFLTSGGVVLR